MGEERETLIRSTYICIRWFILVYALTGDPTYNLGVSGRCSNQLNYAARAELLKGQWLEARQSRDRWIKMSFERNAGWHHTILSPWWLCTCLYLT